MKKSAKRKLAHGKGHWAERLAALALMLKGYRIIALRYRTKLGEIDVIAKKGNLVAMVEVKARPSVSVAVDAVTPTAKSRISNAADIWYSRQPNYQQLSIRFDIIAVCPWSWPVHLEDAF